jgi:hypothetical protein
MLLLPGPNAAAHWFEHSLLVLLDLKCAKWIPFGALKQGKTDARIITVTISLIPSSHQRLLDKALRSNRWRWVPKPEGDWPSMIR